MRILFLTNFYLEQGWGGEDQSCRQVVEGLRQRGHATLVLTSMHASDKVPAEADGVFRSLYLEMDFVPWRNSLTFFFQRRARERHDLQCLERVLEQFRPDIVFIWGMWNLPRSLAALAEARLPGQVVYRFATYWPTLPSQHELYWRATGRTWYGRLPKQALGRVALAMLAREKPPAPLKFEHAICVSAATRTRLVEAGVPVASAQVIHTGLDPQRYGNAGDRPPATRDDHTLELLYAGRLVAEKGVDTAIKALETLVARHNVRNIRLTVAGAGFRGYESYLRHLVAQAGLDDHVAFMGHVPAGEMPELLRRFDVVLVPSIWPEPFSRMVLEGMASGLVVVATPTGGTPEIVTDGRNGLLFAPGDADALSQKIVCLLDDPPLRERLARAGRQMVVERFTNTRMLDEVERYLQRVVDASHPDRSPPVDTTRADRSRAALPTVSVIIPTHNRNQLLHETLQSLAQQTYPGDRFEVIIVDDGSTDGTGHIAAEAFPFTLRYFSQANQGDAAARNTGARQSQADLLVFLDDDVVLEPDYLTHLVAAHERRPNRIVVGSWNLWLPETALPFLTLQAPPAAEQAPAIAELPFTEVVSNNMSIGRNAYFHIGVMQGLDFSGSSMWCDVEFSYRAYRQGFEFRRSARAICWHRDHTAHSLSDYTRRMRLASYRAVVLFQKHPDLLPHVPMFYDKTPIAWNKDPLRLILRKGARAVLSSRPALWSLQQLARVLERRLPASSLLPTLYRYMIGGHIFQGYRQGLGEFGPVDAVNGQAVLS